MHDQMTWTFLISRFIEDGNTWQPFSLSFCELSYSPLEFNANIWQIKRVAIRLRSATQPHVNHHYQSITRPAKATDVRIKRRIFNDCTGNGDFEFSVDPTNLFWRDKRRACALSWTSPFKLPTITDAVNVKIERIILMTPPPLHPIFFCLHPRPAPLNHLYFLACPPPLSDKKWTVPN